MKIALIIIMVVTTTHCYSQATTGSGRTRQKKTIRSSSNLNMVNPGSNNQNVKPRETITERYLKSSATTRFSHDSSHRTAADSSSGPFVTGIHPANNAAKTYDTLNTPANANNVNGATSVNAGSTSIEPANDTVFNANSIKENGITTTSGAVDRSGQAQFGQANWGDSRGTVGEGQWTVPPPITASFNKQFPAVNNATWTRNNRDTSIFSARYNNGTSWIIMNYNAAGERLDMRTEFSLPQPPRPVSIFIAKQPADFQAAAIYRLQVPGKPDLYEIQTKTGRTIYINNDGNTVSF